MATTSRLNSPGSGTAGAHSSSPNPPMTSLSTGTCSSLSSEANTNITANTSVPAVATPPGPDNVQAESKAVALNSAPDADETLQPSELLIDGEGDPKNSAPETENPAKNDGAPNDQGPPTERGPISAEAEEAFLKLYHMIDRQFYPQLYNSKTIHRANDFILDREASMPLRWRTERSKLLSFTVQAYLRLIEDRLAALELDSLEKQKRNSSPERAGQRADSQHSSRSASSSRKEEIHQETRNTNATKPDLNPVPWQDFKQKYDVERNRSQEHTIDILTDDPIIPHDVWRDRYYRQNPMHLQDQRRYRYYFLNVNLQTNSPEKVHKDPPPAAKTAKTSPDFYSPIPDRIRINGEALIQLLDKTFELSIETADKPLVILKPYKVLVHHANGIRRLHQKLANKFEGIATAGMEDENAAAAVAEISNTIPTHGQSNSEDDGGDDFFATEDGRNLLHNHGTEQAYKELGCLVKFMDEYLSPLSRFVNASVQRIYFSDLWHIFQPGEVVITSMNPLNAYRLLHATGGRSYLSPPEGEEEHDGTDYTKPYRVPDKTSDFAVTCYQIDFDGTRFGPVTKEFKIQKFDDQQDVTSLQIYPLRFAKDPAAIRETLSKNGQVFLDLSKAGHVQYRGPNLHEAETIDSQIIVDFHAALSDRQDKDDSWKYEVNFGIQSPVSANEAEVVMVSGGGCKEPDCCENDLVFNDIEIDDRRMEDFIQGNGMLTTDVRYLSDDPKQIDKQDLILFPHRLFAFILKDRKWAVVDVNHILVTDEKTRQRDRAWNSLVLPEGHKPMVYSLVQAHFRSRDQGGPEEEAQQDLIRGKGKGLIILLHGAPGVGKTSTAECVAELCDRPLYPITCGDLGITAVQVESQLKRIFVQAQKWKCVLLLDEADVFLSQRENNVKHNSLVSVFLRVLEYYQGILFLTTNRVGKMDEAFRSRVHISLYYPPLSKDSMLDIFTENIKLIERRTINRVRVKNREILEFASNHYKYNEPHTRWNGRQIRNAFHIAIALAEDDALELEKKGQKGRKTSTTVMRATHFDVVERASTQFDDYLQSVLGMAQSDIARQKSVRKDNWQSNQDHKGKRSDRNSRLPNAYRRKPTRKSESSESGSDNTEVSESDGERSSQGDNPSDQSQSDSGRTRNRGGEDTDGSDDPPTEREKRKGRGNKDSRYQDRSVRIRNEELEVGGKSSKRRASRKER